MCYGEINLFETREETKAFAEAVRNRTQYPVASPTPMQPRKGVVVGATR
jgi:hypothetical protein